MQLLSRTLLQTGLRDLWRRPLHTGLMILGVALGVAVVVAIDQFVRDDATSGWRRFLALSELLREDGGGEIRVPRRRRRASPLARP